MEKKPEGKCEVYVEKETVTKQVGELSKTKTTVRIFIASDGKTRTIMMTPKQFVKFRKDINSVAF